MSVVSVVPVDAVDFSSFWALYPRHIAKAHARIMWARLTAAEQLLALQAIPKHAAAWSSEGREPSRIPHAGSWLNPVLGRRWEDEIEAPVAPKQQVAWWKTEDGVLRMGEDYGVSPRPGESQASFAERVSQAVRIRRAG